MRRSPLPFQGDSDERVLLVQDWASAITRNDRSHNYSVTYPRVNATCTYDVILVGATVAIVVMWKTEETNGIPLFCVVIFFAFERNENRDGIFNEG